MAAAGNNSAGFGARSTYCAGEAGRRCPMADSGSGRCWRFSACSRAARRCAPSRPVRRVVGKSGRAGQVHLLDAAGDLRLGRLAELELVEHVTGDAVLLFGSHRPLTRIVRAGRGQLLMAALDADRRRQLAKRRLNGVSFTSMRPSCSLLVKVCRTPSLVRSAGSARPISLCL